MFLERDDRPTTATRPITRPTTATRGTGRERLSALQRANEPWRVCLIRASSAGRHRVCHPRSIRRSQSSQRDSLHRGIGPADLRSSRSSQRGVGGTRTRLSGVGDGRLVNVSLRNLS